MAKRHGWMADTLLIRLLPGIASRANDVWATAVLAGLGTKTTAYRMTLFFHILLIDDRFALAYNCLMFKGVQIVRVCLESESDEEIVRLIFASSPTGTG